LTRVRSAVCSNKGNLVLFDYERLAHRRVATWIGFGVILIFTLAAYYPALHAQFIWDDDDYVTTNIHLHSFDGLVRLWIPGTTKQYYPAVFTTFWIEYQLWGLHPFGYHLVNVLLHVANALLVWRLCDVLSIPRARRDGQASASARIGAWLIAAVFALHPVHVESVAWITERKNVLSGLFYLMAALAYLRFDYFRYERLPGQHRNTSLQWYGCAVALFICALLSKTVTCSLPAAIILMLLYQRRTLTMSRLSWLIPMVIIGAALGLHTTMLERHNVGAYGPDFQFSFAERLLIACRALVFYPCKLLWPHPLMFIYPRWTIDAHSVAAYAPVLIAMVTFASGLGAYCRGWRGPALALAFYAGTILPALGLVNVYPMLFSFVADHFQYLASLGIIALVISAVVCWLTSARAICIIAGLILPVLAILTFRHASTFHDAETVWPLTSTTGPRPCDSRPKQWRTPGALWSFGRDIIRRFQICQRRFDCSGVMRRLWNARGKCWSTMPHHLSAP
jgi:hypothetical protein